MEIKFESSRRGDVSILRLDGNLDLETAPQLREILMKEMQAGFVKIICNLSAVDYIASAGLGALINVRKLLEGSKGELKLSELSLEAEKIITLCSLQNFFGIYDTDSLALAAFSEKR
jgi:anti-sigma B factor antagonist